MEQKTNKLVKLEQSKGKALESNVSPFKTLWPLCNLPTNYIPWFPLNPEPPLDHYVTSPLHFMNSI